VVGKTETLMLVAPNGTSSGETPLFFEFSLCLSRACLGKMMHFIHKWHRKRVTTFPYQSPRWARRLAWPSASVVARLQKRLLCQLAFLFVPSLSWQTMFIIVEYSIRETFEGKSLSAPTSGQSFWAPRFRLRACETTHLFFECFPYVCPEPAWANVPLLVQNGAKRFLRVS
jgi:hypothetical protein